MGGESLPNLELMCTIELGLSFTLYKAFCPYPDLVLPDIVRREQDTCQLWLRPTLRLARHDLEVVEFF